MLQKIKYIQNIGRFAKVESESSAVFEKCTLIFGENGWGKSTLADILRSLENRDSTIIIGRKTLGGNSEQKAILQFEDGKKSYFDKGSWTGHKPRIAIYDSIFINDNIFSGNAVTKEHLKKQYGLVVGEQGVQLIRQIIDLENENNDNNRSIREAETELKTAIRMVMASSTVPVDKFIALEKRSDIEESISNKQTEVQRALKAKELKLAGEPESFPNPTESEKFKRILETNIDEIATNALEAIRSHATKHIYEDTDKEHMTYESWIEIGASFSETGNCPYCGQALQDRTLVDAYKGFFSEKYKELSKNVQNARQTFTKYKKKEFREKIIQLNKKNQQQYDYWKESVELIPPDMANLPKVIEQMEQAAEQMDNLFQEKQNDLTDALTHERSSEILEAWENGRTEIQHINNKIDTYQREIQALKSSLDPSRLPQIENELKHLKLTKHRYEPDTVKTITQLQIRYQRKEEIKIQKNELREELTAHGHSIITSFSATINTYLKCQNAKFRIDYKEPDHRGKGPSANYQIVIRDVPFNATVDAIDQPGFRNTLSAGDKSNLALAFFLAKTNADPNLAETIVVLDDPFASLDNFRRQSTASEIKKLCKKAKQTIVLSHDKGFLRLLWNKIDSKSITLQFGAPNIMTIASLDIERDTQPKNITDRMKIQEFVAGEPHDPSHIRTLLRKLCEDFYRKQHSNIFKKDDNLGKIIHRIEELTDDCFHKEALEELQDINYYSRSEHHAEIQGNPNEETSHEELVGFCERVLNLTSGME